MLTITDFIDDLHAIKEKHGLDGFFFAAVKDGDTVDKVVIKSLPQTHDGAALELLDDSIIEQTIDALQEREAHALADQLSEVL